MQLGQQFLLAWAANWQIVEEICISFLLNYRIQHPQTISLQCRHPCTFSTHSHLIMLHQLHLLIHTQIRLQLAQSQMVELSRLVKEVSERQIKLMRLLYDFDLFGMVLWPWHVWWIRHFSRHLEIPWHWNFFGRLGIDLVDSCVILACISWPKGLKNLRWQIFIIKCWKFAFFHQMLPKLDVCDKIGIR